MGFKNTSAIVSIGAALLLGFFYIQPAITGIGELQDEIAVFKDNADKVTEVNNRLNSLMNEISSLRQSDVVALETYMPSSADVLQVLYDVETIAARSGLTIEAMSSGDQQEGSTVQESDIRNLDISEEERAAMEVLQSTESLDVEVTVTGSYDNLKYFLDRLAVNHYPIEVMSLSFGETGSDGGEAASGSQSYTLTLRTYAFNYLSNR